MKLHNKKTEKKANEKKLLKRIKQEDREAFIEAYNLYSDQIFRFIYFKTSNKEDAKDLNSLVFLKTWSYIKEGGIDDYKTLRALLYRIARNAVIDHYRKNSNTEKISLDNEDFKIDLPDEKEDLKKQTEIKSDFEMIEKKMEKLKDEYREVIVLKYIEELSVSEIARIINKSKGNTRVIVHRSIKALQELMEEDEK
jgi:RNA polymerase sigma-70 factor (ECF subfamily)